MTSTKNHECAGYLKLRSEYSYGDESLHRAACLGETKWKIKGKHYCLMHAPTDKKIGDFKEALQNKLDAKDYNFSGSWFPGDVTFSQYVFENQVIFAYAEFSGSVYFDSAKFKKGVYFYKAQFNGEEANFSQTQFGAASSFDFAEFSGNTSFYKARFRGAADFRYVKFRGASTKFQIATFSSGKADFSGAMFERATSDLFRGVKFTGGEARFDMVIFHEYADFDVTEFSDLAVFYKVKFNGGVSFGSSHFSKKSYFQETIFSKSVDFTRAIFEDRTFFDKAIFMHEAKVNFNFAHFMDRTRFIENTIEEGTEFCFSETIFEKPEYVYFQSVTGLRPYWFVNTDSRKFNFENADFFLLKGNGTVAPDLELARAMLINNMRPRPEPEDWDKIDPPYQLLVIAYRRLTENAETNNRYEEASELRRMAFETERLERKARRKKWLGKIGSNEVTGISFKSFWPDLKRSASEIKRLAKSYPFGLLQFLYRWLSGYGESWSQALTVMFVIWLVFAVLYSTPLMSFDPNKTGEPLSLWNFSSFAYSFLVMALQKPEPAPINPLGKMLVGIETVFAPIQLALLALAIRRKFMR